MKIIIASDSFKGSCSTMEVANAIEKGLKKIQPLADVIKIPVADGGEGTVRSLISGLGGSYEKVEVVGPTGKKVLAEYGILSDGIAVIEMAAASGLPLLSEEELDPLNTTTYGTGELIKDALSKNCQKIFLGIGGSATNDGGMGMAQALGVSFTDSSGKELGYGGRELGRLEKIDTTCLDNRLKSCEIVVMSDVTNPLCGSNGASYIYGPQKGATKDVIEILDNNLKHYASIIEESVGIDVLDMPGSGAAGGLGAGLIAFCKVEIESGIDKVLEISGIDRHLEDADLVITGEGRIDNQSVNGKVPIGVARRALLKKVPVVAIVGSVGEGASEVYSYGVDAIFDIVSRPMLLEESMYRAPELIEQAAENLMRLILISAEKMKAV